MQAGGVEKILPIGQIDDQEKELLAAAVKELGPSIEKVSWEPHDQFGAHIQGTSFQPAPPKL